MTGEQGSLGFIHHHASLVFDWQSDCAIAHAPELGGQTDTKDRLPSSLPVSLFAIHYDIPLYTTMSVPFEQAIQNPKKYIGPSIDCVLVIGLTLSTGYSSFARFLAAGSNLPVCRRFDETAILALLSKQDAISRVEERLRKLDTELRTNSSNDINNGAFRQEDLFGRDDLIREASGKLEDYCLFLPACHSLKIDCNR